MPSYLLYPSADKRQDEIWEYTVKTWGVVQAEKYITGLHDHMQRLADKSLVWHPPPTRLKSRLKSKTQLYISRYKRHYIFFRPLPDDNIGIITILHDSMKILKHLLKDLKRY
jgi:plasmid stabilization system protein ParE